MKKDYIPTNEIFISRNQSCNKIIARAFFNNKIMS